MSNKDLYLAKSFLRAAGVGNFCWEGVGSEGCLEKKKEVKQTLFHTARFVAMRIGES